MRGWHRIPLALAALAWMATPALGQVNMTMEAPGLDGVREGIEVISVQWGVSNPGAGALTGSRGASVASFSTIELRKGVDAASPQLFLRAANGQILREVTLRFVDVRTGSEWQVIRLQNARVASVRQSAEGQGLTEVIELSFEEITMTVTFGRGQWEATWNVAQGRGG